MKNEIEQGNWRQRCEVRRNFSFWLYRLGCIARRTVRNVRAQLGDMIDQAKSRRIARTNWEYVTRHNKRVRTGKLRSIPHWKFRR